MRVAANSDPE